MSITPKTICKGVTLVNAALVCKGFKIRERGSISDNGTGPGAPNRYDTDIVSVYIQNRGPVQKGP